MVVRLSTFMRKQARAASLMMILTAMGLSAAAYSQDDAEPAVTNEPMKRYSAKTLSFDRWENGLDVKMTSLFNRRLLDFASPTILLTAQWNYRYPSDTYLGLTFSGVPQKSNGVTATGDPASYTTYYGGFSLGQAFYNRSHYRAVVNIAAGYGVLYARSTPAGASAQVIDKPPYTFIEPSVFFTFLDYDRLDIGLIVSYRYANLMVESSVVRRSDVSSASIGLTFRNRMH